MAAAAYSLPQPLRRRQRGFTLIELMVTVTILAVMLGLGVPSFREFLGGQRVKNAAYELMSSLIMARSEAVKRNTTVAITPVSSTAWASGWSVTVAGNTLQQQQSMDGITITPSDSTCAAASTMTGVNFGSTGRPTATGCFKFTGNASSSRCVKLDASGIPSSGKCP